MPDFLVHKRQPVKLDRRNWPSMLTLLSWAGSWCPCPCPWLWPWLWPCEWHDDEAPPCECACACLNATIPTKLTRSPPTDTAWMRERERWRSREGGREGGREREGGRVVSNVVKLTDTDTINVTYFHSFQKFTEKLSSIFPNYLQVLERCSYLPEASLCWLWEGQTISGSLLRTRRRK